MSRSFFQRGGVWVIAQFILLAAVVALAWQCRGHGWGGWLVWLGTALLASGAVFGLAGVVALGRGITPLPKPAARAQFVQTGIYARVRHPLYTSVILGSLGWALVWRSWPALAVALALIPFFHAKARREERWLRESFSGYADYEKRVPKFLPRLRPLRPPVSGFGG